VPIILQQPTLTVGLLEMAITKVMRQVLVMVTGLKQAEAMIKI